MAFNPLKAFQESFKDDLLLNIATGGQFAVAEVGIEALGQGAGATDLGKSLSKKQDQAPLIDPGQTEAETARLREEQERLRRQRQPGRRQTLLSLDPSSSSLLTGF